MSSYRLYFRNRSGRVVGREDIEAANATEAVTVATALCDACSDVCEHFELWDGVVPVPSLRSSASFDNAPELNLRAQQIVLDREISIRDSQWRIAESKRLLSKLEELAVAVGGDRVRAG